MIVLHGERIVAVLSGIWTEHLESYQVKFRPPSSLILTLHTKEIGYLHLSPDACVTVDESPSSCCPK